MNNRATLNEDSDGPESTSAIYLGQLLFSFEVMKKYHLLLTSSSNFQEKPKL
jgi:hypothetical protein